MRCNALRNVSFNRGPNLNVLTCSFVTGMNITWIIFNVFLSICFATVALKQPGLTMVFIVDNSPVRQNVLLDVNY